jgi:hypothetical protein
MPTQKLDLAAAEELQLTAGTIQEPLTAVTVPGSPVTT